MSSVAKNSIIVTIFNIAGTALVFVSNIIIAYKFGAGKAMDVYFAATTAPFFVMTILSMTLSFTFIPIFTAYEKNEKQDRWEIVSSFINSSLVLTTVICAAGMIFSRKIMSIITPGFSQLKIEEAAYLMALLCPAIVACAINELLASVYYAHNRFVTPSLNKILNPLLTILFVLSLGSSLNTKTLALATLSAFLLQTVFLIAGFLRRKDFSYSLRLNFKHPEVINIFKLMAPLTAAMLITKAMPLTDRFFLSRLQEGSISYVSYAYRMTLRIIDSTATGLLVALFPVMSAHAASLDYERLYYYAAKGLKMTVFIVTPFVAIFFIYGHPAIRFLFERGAFTPYDTDSTFKAFSLYLLSLPAVMAGGIFYKGFYSIQKNAVVALISASMMLFYIALCMSLLNVIDYLAIPLSHAISFNASMIISGLVLRRYLNIKGSYGIAREVFKNASSAAIAVLCIRPIMGIVKDSPLFYFLTVAFGFGIYFVLGKIIFHIEASAILWDQMVSYRDTFFSRRCRG